MATETKQPNTPRPAATKPTAKSTQPQREQYFLFDKMNYILMVAGIVLIFIGFMLLSGGKSPNPHEFHYEEIYSFRRITLAPIVLLLGFIVEAYAIMRKPADAEEVQ